MLLCVSCLSAETRDLSFAMGGADTIAWGLLAVIVLCVCVRSVRARALNAHRHILRDEEAETLLVRRA